MTALVSVQENSYKQRLGRDGLGSLREDECKAGGAKPNSLRWLSLARNGTGGNGCEVSVRQIKTLLSSRKDAWLMAGLPAMSRTLHVRCIDKPDLIWSVVCCTSSVQLSDSLRYVSCTLEKLICFFSASGPSNDSEFHQSPLDLKIWLTSTVQRWWKVLHVASTG